MIRFLTKLFKGRSQQDLDTFRQRAQLLHTLIVERIEFNATALLDALVSIFNVPKDRIFRHVKADVTLYAIFKVQEVVRSRLPEVDANNLLKQFNSLIGKTPSDISKILDGFHEDVLGESEKEFTPYVKKELVEKVKELHQAELSIGIPERVLIHYLKEDLTIIEDNPRMYVLAALLKPDIDRAIEECIGDRFYDWELRNGAWHNKKEKSIQ